MRQSSWIVCTCLALASLWLGSDATAEDAKPRMSGKIVVVGPDGVKKEFDLGNAHKDCDAKGYSIQVRVDDGKVTVIGPKGKKQEFNIDEKGDKDHSVKVEVRDGKLTIDGDGKPQKIDLEGLKEQVEKGVKRGHIMGKAVIIGPDGKPTEIDLGAKLGNLDLDQLLPKEARKQLDKALEGQPEHIRKMLEGHHAFGRLAARPPSRATLGVTLDGSNGEAQVAGVLDGSPAKKAGLREDDVVISVDDKEIKSPAELMSAIAKHKPGDSVEIKIRRGNEEITKKVTLEERAKLIPERPVSSPDRDLQRQIRRLEEQNKRLVERIEKLEKAIEKKSE